MQVRLSLTKYHYPAFFALFRSCSLFFTLVSLTNLALIIFLLGCILLWSLHLVRNRIFSLIFERATSIFLVSPCFNDPQAYNNPQILLTPINATKPLKISGFVNVCYKFIVVLIYPPKLSYIIDSGSTPRESSIPTTAFDIGPGPHM